MRIKRINYLNIYSIEEYESWLSYMAKNGFLLEEIHYIRSTFLKCEPCEKLYHIETFEKHMALENINIYKSKGWEFICSYKNMYVFSASPENISNLNNDLKGQSFGLNKKIEILLCLTLPIMIGAMLMLFVSHNILSIGSTPHINFYTSDWKIYGFVLEIIMLFIYLVIQIFKNIYISRKSADIRKKINHHTCWKKSCKINFCLTNTILFFSMLFFILIIADMSYSMIDFVESINGNSHFSLETQTKISIPIARLADIENLKNAMPKQYSDSKITNPFNNVKKEYGLFIRKHYTIVETILSKNDNEDISINTDYYELLLPFMAEGVLKDLVKSNENKYNGVKHCLMIRYVNFDQVYFLPETGGFYSLFIKKGNIVEHVTYYGSQPYKNVLNVIAKSLDK
jgi:Protein of unknown function (DUF2812).